MIILSHKSQELFALIAMGALLAFISSRSVGPLFASLASGGGAIASFSIDIWWPLGAAFACACILRIWGLDPSPN